MQKIESCSHPLVCRVTGASCQMDRPHTRDGQIAVRAAAQALAGMQKQALVFDSANQAVWRMLCDEGPYLNGTDQAPFPLAFFATGLALSYLGEIEALAAERDIVLSDVSLILDNWYSMHGSALHGTMAAGALPAELVLEARSDADPTTLTELVADAVLAALGNALLRDVFQSGFSITHNAARVKTKRVVALKCDPLPRPEAALKSARPDSSHTYAADIIRKLSSAKTVFGVEGGAGSSLQADQKRFLHVRGIARRRRDGLYEVDTQLFKPIGSVFRFLGDACGCFGGYDRAPSAHAYLSAGIAFCYLTQIGRFAHIAKQRLDYFSLVQDTRFSLPGASGHTSSPAWATAVQSHVHVDSPESPDAIRHLVDMGEQTCFLHAACRTPLKTHIHVRTRTGKPAIASRRDSGNNRHPFQAQA